MQIKFAIPKTRNVAPERLVKTIGNPTESSVKNALFGWNDIKSVRENSRLYIFMNDDGAEVTSAIEQACSAYEAAAVPWSDAERFASDLAA